MAEDNKKRRQWQVPKYGSASKEEVHDWMKQQVEDGKERQEQSPGFQQLEEAVRILSGRPSKELSEKQKDGYSKVQTQRMKRNLREMVNSLAEIRYNPGYHSKNKDTIGFAENLNSVGQYWYTDSFVDLKVKKALQWAGISPCGWLEICYREIPGNHGQRTIDLVPMSWFDVVQTGIVDEEDHQQSYTVTIIKDLPIYLAHALFPEHQKILKPDRESPKGWMEKMRDKAAKVIRDVFDPSPETSTAKDPTCRIYYQYVIDLAINKSKSRMKMGYEKKKVKIADGIEREEEVATPWSYEVPYVGEMVQRGYDTQGLPTFQPATPDECKIFPGRRLIIGNEMHNLYDGPMFDWHGKAPLIKFCADSWPFGEFSMVHDVAPLHEAINEIDRISAQTLRNRFDPTMMFNARAIGPDKAKTVRLDKQGQRIGYNGQEVGTHGPMHPLVDKAFNVIETWVESLRKYFDDTLDYQMGVRDIASLSKLKLGGSQDSIERALELAGPIVKGISRDMERSMRDLADMFKYMVVQYMRAPELLQIVGRDQMTPETFDYNPGNMIPSHLPHEDKQRKSIYSEMQRARWQAENAKFIIQPGTLHEITQTAQKLLYLQLWRDGRFPMDPVTLGEVLRLGNVGHLDGNTMIERSFNWKKKELEMMAELMELKKKLMGDEGGEPQGGKGPRGGQKNTGGRAPSGGAAPQIASKDGGTRQTVKESH